MTVRVGINGFGRIGRSYLRAALRSDADVSIYLQRIARKLLELSPSPAVGSPSAERARPGQAPVQPPTGTASGFSRG